MDDRSVPVERLRSHGKLLEDAVRQNNLATPEEVDAIRPGGRSNPDEGPDGWLHYYGRINRLHARGEEREATPQRSWMHPDEDAMVMAALAAEPIVLSLAPAKDGEPPREFTVHPKSLHALMVCHARDNVVGWLAERRLLLQGTGDPDDLALVERSGRELAYQFAVLAWIVSTPGPGLPFPDGTNRPEPPPEMLALEPWEMLRIQRAFAEVNGHRLEAMSALVGAPKPGDKGRIRPSWSVFVGSLAQEKGIPASRLMRDWTLAGLLGESRLAGAAHADAHEAAKEKANQGRKAGVR